MFDPFRVVLLCRIFTPGCNRGLFTFDPSGVGFTPVAIAVSVRHQTSAVFKTAEVCAGKVFCLKSIISRLLPHCIGCFNNTIERPTTETFSPALNTCPVSSKKFCDVSNTFVHFLPNFCGGNLNSSRSL